MKPEKVCEDSFKQAMACFPSGVTIVTTVDDIGQKYGFTASAFSSLSLTPPLILVCLANNADCFDIFNNQKKFAVNIIGAEHEALAFKFATKGLDKFDGGEFEQGSYGLPILSDCPVSLECNTENIYSGGDHIILVGQVKYLSVNGGTPSVWQEGKFHQLNI
jgi:flavin reductase ActVB